jgi:hypothetical protein
VLNLVLDKPLGEQIRSAALAAVRGRTWETSIEQLAQGYRGVLDRSSAATERQIA